MKRGILNLLFIIIAFGINAQDVLTIDDNNISLNEFKSIFYKNNHDSKIDKAYLDEYMELFVNFKLKVKEAEELRMDTIATFINELEGYKKQLAKPYLKNKEFDDSMVIESYDRLLEDINASHILISIDENSSDLDLRSAAYDKALIIRKDILNDKISFSEAARKYSDDKSASSNNGDLGYFTAFMMVYDFESAAYTTTVGDVSMPVRTKYGYHLIKVNDKRPAVGQVQVAHIMFKTGKGADQDRLNKAKDKIIDIGDKLRNGVDFSDLAERFSEDRSSAVKGGDLPSFGVGKMVPEFENIAFNLKQIGDVSQPFQTEFGWHIIKLLEKEGIPRLDNIRDDIKKKIERDSRGELSKKALYNKLRLEYRVSNKVDIFSSLRIVAVNEVKNGSWDGKFENLELVLFTINSENILVDDFVSYLLENQVNGSDFDNMYQDFVNARLLFFEETQLDDKYPEYKALLKEYREGILLFDLTNKKVWTKAVKDTSGLQEYFKNNIDQYKWKERVDATIYSCIDLSTARKVRARIFKKKLGFIVSDEEFLEQVNVVNPLSLQIESKKFVVGDNKYIDSLEWKVGVAANIKLEDESILVIEINKLLDETHKELDETRGKVISDYQGYLEEEWVAKLRKKYKVKINNRILYSLIN